MLSLRNLFRLWRKKRFNYEPLIEVRIYRQQFLKNFQIFSERFPNHFLAPVLKSNAYGHGLVQVAHVLNDSSVAFFCVDSFFEALVLRNEGITKPILILGYTPINNILSNTLRDVAFSILSLDELEILNNNLKKITNFHLKVDTGMHRHGIDPDHLGRVLAIIKNNKFINIEGTYSHLADADNNESLYTESQIIVWNKASSLLKDELKDIKYLHCAATFGSKQSEKINANTIRLGLGLYGFDPENNHNIAPVLDLRARISSIRKIKAGEIVGYNASFKADKDIFLATIPVGYNEGLDRRLSNIGQVLVKGKLCPLVGRISMNIASIDISSVEDVNLEEEVIVISKETGLINSVNNIAKLCETIPYEILVHIPSHLRRLIF